MRLFLAIDLPHPIQEVTSELMLPELQQVRWSPLQQLHVTLVFIGEQPSDKLDEIIEAIAEVPFESFPLTLNQIGHFRSGVIWLGVENNEPLNRLQKSLSHKIRSLGIALEQRRYIPHLTFGRCKNLTPEILGLLGKQALGLRINLDVSAFQLKRSILSSDGAVYETLCEFTPDK
jgi:2'-5' RNA ligase